MVEGEGLGFQVSGLCLTFLTNQRFLGALLKTLEVLLLCPGLLVNPKVDSVIMLISKVDSVIMLISKVYSVIKTLEVLLLCPGLL